MQDMLKQKAYWIYYGKGHPHNKKIHLLEEGRYHIVFKYWFKGVWVYETKSLHELKLLRLKGNLLKSKPKEGKSNEKKRSVSS